MDADPAACQAGQDLLHVVHEQEILVVLEKQPLQMLVTDASLPRNMVRIRRCDEVLHPAASGKAEFGVGE
ncbi:MAG: hypothetical protein D4R65_10705 [Verrucomicrobiaceae bacterium]|nr:MAG: hypothetical protein D4R65_10705 [Verrucomicrobiaceae bacterium]